MLPWGDGMGKGYTIEYEGTKRYPVSTRRKYGVFQFIGLLFISLITVAVLLFPQARQSLRSFLIPGDDQITINAADELIDRLHNGENTQEALVTFCRMILEDGT